MRHRMEDRIQRMKELVSILREAGKAYYQESREIMSNFEYDKLYDELVSLEKETGVTLSGSGHKGPVHDIQMDILRSRIGYGPYFLSQPGKIGCQYGWR